MVHLHRLTLISVDDGNYLSFLFGRLENHHELQSLAIENASIQINKKVARQIATTLQSLSSLKSLKYFESSALLVLREPLSQLIHLTLRQFRFNELDKLISFVPNLVSLELFLPYQPDRLRCDHKLFHLKFLKLRSSVWFLVNDIGQLFSPIPVFENLILGLLVNRHYSKLNNGNDGSNSN